jgi:hypothetical protein
VLFFEVNNDENLLVKFDSFVLSEVLFTVHIANVKKNSIGLYLIVSSQSRRKTIEAKSINSVQIMYGSVNIENTVSITLDTISDSNEIKLCGIIS